MRNIYIFFAFLEITLLFSSSVYAGVCKKDMSGVTIIDCHDMGTVMDCKSCDADCNEVPNAGETPSDECMQCSATGMVRNIDKIKAHNDGLADCRKAVEEEIGRQYIELEKIYKEAKKIIHKEAAKLSKECEKKFDKKGWFYEALVFPEFV